MPSPASADACVNHQMNFNSGASVVTFGTAKSSLSKLSRRSQNTTTDALTLSHATAQAAQAAKAILDAGGSELTALKTAKAAAVSALMPESPKQEMTHGIGSSFLRRRKMKRQADVVASMALAAALAGGCKSPACQSAGNVSAMTEWDQESRTTLQGMKIVNEQKSTETLSTKESSQSESSNPEQTRPSASGIISQQLKLIPSWASNFSGASNKSGGLSRQVSSFTQSPRMENHFSQMPSPQKLLPRNISKKQQQKRNEKRELFVSNSGCLRQSFSDDESIESDDMLSSVGAVDAVLISMVNAITCAPIFGGRPREVRVPHMDDIDEEEDFEETITFDDESEYGQDANSRDENEEEAHDADDEAWDNDMEQEAEMETAPSAESGDSSGSTGDEILRDLLATATQSYGYQSSGANARNPAVITSSDRNTIELQVPNMSESVDDLSMSGASSDGNHEQQHDESANYVQIVTPQRRNRRLARGYTNMGSPSPATPRSPGRGVSMFRGKWRK